MLRQLLHNLGGNLRNLGIAGVAILFERDERDEDDEDDAFDGPVRTQAAESPSAGPCPRPPDLERLVNRAIVALRPDFPWCAVLVDWFAKLVGDANSTVQPDMIPEVVRNRAQFVGLPSDAIESLRDGWNDMVNRNCPKPLVRAAIAAESIWSIALEERHQELLRRGPTVTSID